MQRLEDDGLLESLPDPQHLRSLLSDRVFEVKLIRQLLRLSESLAARTKTQGFNSKKNRGTRPSTAQVKREGSS